MAVFAKRCLFPKFVNGELFMTRALFVSAAVVLLSVVLAPQAAARPGSLDGLDTSDQVQVELGRRDWGRPPPSAARRHWYWRLWHARFLRDMTGYNRAAMSGELKWEEFVAGSAELPAAVDWREAGAVSAVRDQGDCGSCWAFSAVGAIEGQYFLKYGELVPLSAQELVDCSSAYGNTDCSGGSMEAAFKYVRDRGGISAEHTYPYGGVAGECRAGETLVGTAGLRVAVVRAGDEEALRAAAAAGPVAVAVDASPPSFRAYAGGVYHDPACSDHNINHAMLLVGYGTDADGDYWLLRNTWGAAWGQRGYMKLARNRNNHCGVASAAAIPVL